MIASAGEVLVYMQIAATATEMQRALLNLLAPLAEVSVKGYLGYNFEQKTHTHYLPDQAYGFGADDSSADIIGGRVALGINYSDVDTLIVPELPLRSITSLYEDPAALAGSGPNDFPAATLLTEGTDFYVDWDQPGLCKSGFIKKYNWCWPARARTVKLTYVAGYSAAEIDGQGLGATNFGGTDPGQVKLACIQTIIAEYQRALATMGKNSGPMVSESISTSSHSRSLSESMLMSMVNASMPMPDSAKQLCQPFRRMFRR